MFSSLQQVYSEIRDYYIFFIFVRIVENLLEIYITCVPLVVIACYKDND